ncbi:MAG TPA: mechanosensitive ion channel domain-containing protein [Acidocella sp.]|nr:mechanosensitive ion channel domain-containing protein [Acidocella sp.]
MRFLLLLTFVAMLVPGLAGAAQPAAAPAPAPATAQPAAPQPAPAAPAKTAPTIIPGSPLAALTGAGAQPPQETPAPAPFGTNELGFAITAVLGQHTTRTFSDFTDALERSTRLTPTLAWLQSFASSAQRRANALAAFRGVVVAILPGIALDFAVLFLLRKPMAFCARHGFPQRSEYLPHPDTDGLANAEEGESEPLPHRRVSLRAVCRRLIFALLNFGLALLPLAVFAIAVQLFLSAGFVSKRPAYLAVIGIANAYIIARLAQEILRLLFSPGAPSLRLVRLSTPHAAWAMRRVMVLIVTIFVSFCLISIAEILGLSKDGASALIRLAALAATLESALDIWQSRRVISRWIAGRPEAEGFIAGMRHRFSKTWYVFTLFYVLALWVAWAGGVQNAVGVLLRAVLVVLAALILGRLAWTGSNNLLARLFPDIGTGKPRDASSHLLVRAHSYNPLIRFLVRAAIGVLVLLLMLQGWGVNVFTWLLDNTISRALLSVVFSVLVTVAIAILLWEFSIFQLEHRVDKLHAAGRTRQATRLRTLVPMLRAAIGVVLVLVTLIVCLSSIGVNTTGLLAVSSVVGIAVGFGSQKLVQDIITGLFLLFEDAMQVGDVVSLAGMSGTVERLSIRTIQLRSGDGSVNLIPFSSVTTVTNQTRDFNYAQISIMVGYHEDIDRVTAVLKEIGAKMRAEAAWGAMMRDDLQLYGLDSFNELGLVITGQIRTGPGQNSSVRREFYGRVQRRFAEEGIELSYRHQTLSVSLPPSSPGPG